MASTGAEIYGGAGLGVLLGQDYAQAMEEPITRADQLEDQRFIEVTKSVIIELANEGNAVIISRASNLILKDRPDAFHVGLVSTLEARIATSAKREQVSLEQARILTIEQERARVIYFKKYFQANVDNPADYHIILNTHRLGHETSANFLVSAFNSVFSR